MSFLEPNYNRPIFSNDFKPAPGKNKLRILSKTPVFALQGWVPQSDGTKKPITIPATENFPSNLIVQDRKFIWSLVVWSYDQNAIKLWKCGSAKIQDALKELVENEDYGPPNDYDITVTRTGEGLKTKYGVLASPKKPLEPEIAEAYLKSEIKEGDIFQKKEKEDKEDEHISVSEIPF